MKILSYLLKGWFHSLFSSCAMIGKVVFVSSSRWSIMLVLFHLDSIFASSGFIGLTYPNRFNYGTRYNPTHTVLFPISSLPSLQYPSYPLNNWIPRIPNTSKNNITIIRTCTRAGIDSKRAFTTVLIPSFFETTLSGRRALRARKPLKKLTSPVAYASKIQVTKEKNTMTKSRIFHGSFK